MNRFDRITAILIQLQSRKIVKAQDLAERFEISLRTVYRDMSTLAEAGVPIIGEAGVGYSIMEGYRLPPVMFTKEEARTFITAEKLVEKFTDFSTQNHYQSAMFKIKAVLRSSEKSMVETLENHIEVRRNNVAFNTASSNVLDCLLKSISEKKAVRISYLAMTADIPGDRVIEPVGIYHETSYWYTIAFCHLRNAYRNFRSDRIQRIEITEQSFEHQHAPLNDFLNEVRENRKVQLVVVRVAKNVARYIGDQKYYYGFVSEKIIGDQLEMAFLTESLEWFAHWYLMIAPNAIVIEPEILKSHLKKLISQISESLQL
ncbi:helix-turn-helix transcriptional regulator [Dyadobacter psychrotolerans]|uniref:YafY family transcriptional regulator n=1 Tax=Dyadobacter psychrotolerans TaxID=2541721 RepID=A0A4R5E157_9BACT|nr:YafY family protein [Dyadobacter psychrotolerans]TDE17645.1 YafY family transcriptional regulator [Dyadobacter psychrotolerans]